MMLSEREARLFYAENHPLKATLKGRTARRTFLYIRDEAKNL